MGGPELWKLFEGAPHAVQLLVGGVLALGLVWFGLPQYLKKLREPAQPSPSDVVLMGGTIASMKPVEEAAKQLARVADNVAEVVRLMTEREEREEKAREREEMVTAAEVARLQRLVEEYEARAAQSGGFPPNRRHRK